MTRRSQLLLSIIIDSRVSKQFQKNSILPEILSFTAFFSHNRLFVIFAFPKISSNKCYRPPNTQAGTHI